MHTQICSTGVLGTSQPVDLQRQTRSPPGPDHRALAACLLLSASCPHQSASHRLSNPSLAPVRPPDCISVHNHGRQPARLFISLTAVCCCVCGCEVCASLETRRPLTFAVCESLRPADVRPGERELVQQQLFPDMSGGQTVIWVKHANFSSESDGRMFTVKIRN